MVSTALPAPLRRGEPVPDTHRWGWQLTADGDANSTPEMTRAMAAAAPHGCAVVIEGHRHMVNLTAPQAVSEALQSWLSTTEIAA